MRIAFLLLLMSVSFQVAFTQENQAPEKEYKNTIRFNITNPLIVSGRSIIFGYERILPNNQSFSINVGQTALPNLGFINRDSLEAHSNIDQKGFNFSADYRFYLSKENKFNAPRGVYIGPYYSFNYMERKDNWTLKSTSGGTPQGVESNSSLSIHSVGFEMGYQFVFWKRVSLDMVLAGPGLSTYNLKASLASNLSEEDKSKFFEALNQALADKIPGYSRVIDEGEFQNKGTASTTSLGFRYMIMVGYRF